MPFWQHATSIVNLRGAKACSSFLARLMPQLPNQPGHMSSLATNHYVGLSHFCNFTQHQVSEATPLAQGTELRPLQHEYNSPKDTDRRSQLQSNLPQWKTPWTTQTKAVGVGVAAERRNFMRPRLVQQWLRHGRREKRRQAGICLLRVMAVAQNLGNCCAVKKRCSVFPTWTPGLCHRQARLQEQQ